MKIATKELAALEWVASKDGLGVVDVEHHIDGAGVGWLLASIDRDRANGFHHHRTERFVVSPLGHVYADKAFAIGGVNAVPERGDLVREGPGPG